MTGLRAGMGQRIAQVQLRRVADRLAIDREHMNRLPAHARRDVHFLGVKRRQQFVDKPPGSGEILGGCRVLALRQHVRPVYGSARLAVRPPPSLRRTASGQRPLPGQGKRQEPEHRPVDADRDPGTKHRGLDVALMGRPFLERAPEMKHQAAARHRPQVAGFRQQGGEVVHQAGRDVGLVAKMGSDRGRPVLPRGPRRRQPPGGPGGADQRRAVLAGGADAQGLPQRDPVGRDAVARPPAQGSGLGLGQPRARMRSHGLGPFDQSAERQLGQRLHQCRLGRGPFG